MRQNPILNNIIPPPYLLEKAYVQSDHKVFWQEKGSPELERDEKCCKTAFHDSLSEIIERNEREKVDTQRSMDLSIAVKKDISEICKKKDRKTESKTKEVTKGEKFAKINMRQGANNRSKMI